MNRSDLEKLLDVQTCKYLEYIDVQLKYFQQKGLVLSSSSFSKKELYHFFEHEIHLIQENPFTVFEIRNLIVHQNVFLNSDLLLVEFLENGKVVESYQKEAIDVLSPHKISSKFLKIKNKNKILNFIFRKRTQVRIRILHRKDEEMKKLRTAIEKAVSSWEKLRKKKPGEVGYSRFWTDPLITDVSYFIFIQTLMDISGLSNQELIDKFPFNKYIEHCNSKIKEYEEGLC